MQAFAALDRVAFAGTSGAPIKPRKPLIEAIRVVSAFGIIWFHSHEVGSSIAYSGLTIFLMLQAYYETLSHRSDGFINFAKIWNLLIPWCFWFVIFALLNLLKGRSAITMDEGLLSGVLYGPSPHLWFLPFSCFVICLIAMCKRAFGAEFIAVAAGVGLILATGFDPSLEVWSETAARPIPQWIEALVPVLAGIVFALRLQVPFAKHVVWVAIGLCVMDAIFQHSFWAISHCLGLLVVVLSIENNDTTNYTLKKFALISKYMLGVYLSHPLFLGFATHVLPNHLWLAVVVTFCVSLAVVWIVGCGSRLKHYSERAASG